jgi:AcrR family transcriptional regulator
MSTKKQTILETASLLFLQKGIKRTSVDDIASGSGISKKTFYFYFKDKEAIISEIVTKVLVKIEKYIRILPCISPNAISELIKFFQFMQGNVYVFTPQFIKDLTQFYPGVNDMIIQYRTSKFLPFFIGNIQRGIYEEIYRKTIDSTIIGEMYFLQLDHALEDDSLDMSERLRKLAFINAFFVNGVVNERGAKFVFTSS